MKMLVYTIHSPNVYNVLVHLINSSIESNVYPDCFKMSTVISLPKINEANNVSHYRPISLQSHLSKFFEKAVKSQFMNYLEGIIFCLMDNLGSEKTIALNMRF